MLIWINGAFGAGKTSVATELVAARPDLRLFDAEWVGYLLRANLADVPNDDFQDLPPWRTLVPRVAAELAGFTGQSIVVVQSVLSATYWRELRLGLVAEGFDLVHVVLDCDPVELARRVTADEVERQAERWRLDHIEAYLDSRAWLLRDADLVVDTTELAITAVVELISARVPIGSR